jgi:hypothetical protein
MAGKRIKPYVITEVDNGWYRGPGPWFTAVSFTHRMLPFGAPVLEHSPAEVRATMLRAHPDYAEQLRLFEEGTQMAGSESIESGGEQR